MTGLPGNMLDYLYLIAISGEKVPDASKAAYDYFLSRVGGLLPSSSMKMKALAAVVLDKAGHKKEAQEFIASLKEHLTKTDGQGMSFAFNENPFDWGGMKIQTHVDVMEALELVGGNEKGMYLRGGPAAGGRPVLSVRRRRRGESAGGGRRELSPRHICAAAARR